MVSRGESLRVLICIESLGIGGKERQAVELIKALVRAPDIECVVICLESDDFYLHELARMRIPVDFMTRRGRWDMSLFPRFYKTIRRYQPHIIHTNGLMSSFYALPVARLMGIPVINGSIRNAFAEGGFRWNLEKVLLRAADYRVANS